MVIILHGTIIWTLNLWSGIRISRYSCSLLSRNSNFNLFPIQKIAHCILICKTYFILKHVSLTYLLCSIQLRPARHKRCIEQIFRQLSVPLCHGPTGSQCRGRGHLQELSAQAVVPFKPVILRDSSRYGPSFAEVFSRQLQFTTGTAGASVCLCCEFCLFGLATAR